MRRVLMLLLPAVALVAACVPHRQADPGPATLAVPVTVPVETSPGLVEGTPGPGSQPVGRNEDWTPMIEAFDGVEMALVPAGCFPMGSTDEQVDDAMQRCEQTRGPGGCERDWYRHEQPAHTVCFDEPFWIDRYEVTNARYGSAGTWAGDQLPREGVNWAEAAAHCAGRGARLPTEAEWEYAARGPDGLAFPWRDRFNGSLLNACDPGCEWNLLGTGVDDGYDHTAPVGSYTEGASWVGALDMSGNVWEWTGNIYGPYPYREPDGGTSGEKRRVLRGGAWFHTGTDLLRSAARYPVSPEYADTVTGFRCVLSVASSQ